MENGAAQGTGGSGTGGYVETLMEPYYASIGQRPSTSGTLVEQWDMKVTQAETARLQAEAAAAQANADFLTTQMGMTDPKTINLAQLMPTDTEGLDYTILALIAVAVWYFYKGGKL